MIEGCLCDEIDPLDRPCLPCEAHLAMNPPTPDEELDRLRPIVAAAKAWAISRRLDVDPMRSDAARRRYETAEDLVAALANAGEL